MKKNITYKELQVLDTVITNYLINNGYYNEKEKRWTEKEGNKLTVNMQNLAKQAQKHFDKYFEKKRELEVDFCSEDESKNPKVIMKDQYGNMCYTKENQKKLYAELIKLNETQVEIHARITDGDYYLNNTEKEIFNGILIPAFDVPNENE